MRLAHRNKMPFQQTIRKLCSRWKDFWLNQIPKPVEPQNIVPTCWNHICWVQGFKINLLWSVKCFFGEKQEWDTVSTEGLSWKFYVCSFTDESNMLVKTWRKNHATFIKSHVTKLKWGMRFLTNYLTQTGSRQV